MAFAGIGTKRKSCAASVCRFPPPNLLSYTPWGGGGGGGRDFVDAVEAHIGLHYHVCNPPLCMYLNPCMCSQRKSSKYLKGLSHEID
jgi:hypothetical protein